MAFPVAPQKAKPKEPKSERDAALDQERAEQLYNELRPEALRMYIEYFSARTPIDLRDEMSVLVMADMPSQPDPDQLTENAS